MSDYNHILYPAVVPANAVIVAYMSVELLEIVGTTGKALPLSVPNLCHNARKPRPCGSGLSIFRCDFSVLFGCGGRI